MRPRRIGALVGAAVVLTATACGRPVPVFSTDNARAHVERLAGDIGSRPVGTAANARARAYILDYLRFLQFDVRVQETDARRPELGLTARVANIIGTLGPSGESTAPGAIALVAHYDSVAASPGAADDASGVAVALEAARVLGARSDRRHGLMLFITDAEEAGLLGAAGLVSDPSLLAGVRAYVNLEAIGSGGAALLFETGPGNGWLVQPWRRRAPHPRGGSYALEVYKRLPNDTDFSILKASGIPGLNFALVDDSYAYHTSRDTPARLSNVALRRTGENVVSTITALDREDLSRRSSDSAVYFPVLGRGAAAYGPATARVIAAAALVLGLIAWGRVLAAALRVSGPGRVVLSAAWGIAALATASGAMVGSAWILRASRPEYHPWYASPDRFFAMLAIAGLVGARAVGRIGAIMPARMKVPRHPANVWAIALPCWLAFAAAAEWRIPSAAYLWTVPLLTAAILFALLPARPIVARLASILVLGVTGALWFPEFLDLLRFGVAVFGRQPVITPIWVYPALMAAAALMIAPPAVAALMATAAPRRPSLVTAAVVLSYAVAAGLAWAAPGYTGERPLRREVRYIQDAAAERAYWEVGSVEPGLDLRPGNATALMWQPVSDAPRTSLPLRPMGMPFTFRAETAAAAVPPASITAATRANGADVDLEVTAVPLEPGVAISLALPAGVQPVRTNLPGARSRRGYWFATYVAPPSDGIAFRVTVRAADAPSLSRATVVITSDGLPGGAGWQRLPPWLPQETAAWHGVATFLLPVGRLLDAAPVPPAATPAAPPLPSAPFPPVLR